MKALVAYDSKSGYTEQIALAIGAALKDRFETKVKRVGGVTPTDLVGLDLLLVGGPTQAHGATPALRQFLDSLGRATLSGLPAAAFDTRLHWPKVLSGSAADQAARHLREVGCRLIAPTESFFVGHPVDGSKTPWSATQEDLAHARAWATELMSALASPVG